jgi:NADPH:quinone reductase-like Zn-dependent oxidoreductase
MTETTLPLPKFNESSDQLLIKTVAASINPVDYKAASQFNSNSSRQFNIQNLNLAYLIVRIIATVECYFILMKASYMYYH